jgi:hypothetical protein
MVIALLLESGNSFNPYSFGDRRKKLHLRRHRGGKLVLGNLLEVDRIANERIYLLRPAKVPMPTAGRPTGFLAGTRDANGNT